MSVDLANTNISTALFIVPAYGNTYATEEEVLAAWNSGVDFKIFHGPYISIRDMDTIRGTYSIAFINYGAGVVEI